MNEETEQPREKPATHTFAEGASIPYDPDHAPNLNSIVYVVPMLRALGHTTRFNGVIPVSVLKHLAAGVLAVEGLMRSGRAWAPDPAWKQPRQEDQRTIYVRHIAAHDLHEAVIGDVPAYMKALLPDFVALEERWEAKIKGDFGLRGDPVRTLRINVLDMALAHAEMMIYRYPGQARVDCVDPAVMEAAIRATAIMVNKTQDEALHIVREALL